MGSVLAQFAADELAARENHWPAKVAAGEMTQAEADAGIAAWRAIERLFRSGQVETGLDWPALVEAAQGAVDSRLAKSLAAPGEAAAEQRLGAVFAIRQALIRSARAGGAFAYRRAA